MKKPVLAICFLLSFATSYTQSQYMYGSENQVAVGYFLKGWHHIMDLGEWSLAEEYFRKAVQEDPNFTIGKTLVGRISRDFEERKRILEDLADERGGLSKSERALYDIFKLSIESMNQRELGIKSSRRDRIENSNRKQKLFREFLSKQPEESYIKAEYIETLAATRGAKDAIDSLLSLTSSKERELGFYKTYLASLYSEVGDFQKAEDLLQEFSQSFAASEKPPALFYSFGELLYAKQEVDLAYEKFKQAIRIDTNHLIALSALEKAKKDLGILFDSENLQIIQFTQNTLLHISYLESKNFGKVRCNGLIAVNGGEAVVFDTPSDASSSQLLLDFLANELELDIKYVVPTHHHVDCLGGLKVFHDHDVASLALGKTKILAKDDGWELPQMTFARDTVIDLGEEKVFVFFPGEGHTKDNVIGYYGQDSVLFGGCLIKSLGAPKGNLADANLDQWSKSAENAKLIFPNTRHVIPGHGKAGGKELIDYTSKLFRPDPIVLNEKGEVIEHSDHHQELPQKAFETVARANRGYVYEILDFGDKYSSVRILKDGDLEFEYLANKSKNLLDLEEIDVRRDEWIRLCNEHNAGQLVEEMYSSDAVYYNHKPLVRGRKGITKDYQYMNRPNYSLNLSPLKVYPVNKNIVFEIGQCSGSYGGKYIIIWRKEADKVWRVFLDSNI